MSYRQPTNKGRLFIVLILIFVVAVVAILPLRLQTQTWALGLAGRIFAETDKIEDALGNPLTYFRSKAKLEEENESLKARLMRYELIANENQLLKAENELFQKMLDRKTGSPQKIASVLTGPPNASYNTLIIDLGRDAGVEVGNYVFSSDGILLGTVNSLTSYTSRVSLYSSAGRKTRVVIDGLHVAEAVGRGGLNLEITLPRDLDIKTGALVTLSSPGVSLLGAVEHVEKNPRESFQKILIRSAYSFSSHEFVLISDKIDGLEVESVI